MTTGQLQNLYEWTNAEKFILTQSQDITKRFAIICYRSVGRDGADDEADCLRLALEEAMFTVAVHEWQDITAMKEWLYDRVHKKREEMSILFLSIMSHGYSGKIQGANMSTGYMILQTRARLEYHIPIVSIIKSLLTGLSDHTSVMKLFLM